MTDLTLSYTRLIAAPPETVYAAWLTPDTMRRFMAGGAEQRVTKAETDPRIGGRFLVTMTSDKDITHTGTYLALQPHSLIRFTWESPYSPADSEVTLRFAPTDTGTEVTLTQIRFLSESARDGHLGGWSKILARLDALMTETAA